MWRLTFSIRDYSGNVRTTSVTVLFIASGAQAVEIANQYWAVIAPLTTGTLVGCRVEMSFTTEGGSASPTSDVFDTAFICFTNNDKVAIVKIPAPASDIPWETVGRYKGIRVRPGNPVMDERIEALKLALTNTLTPFGEPFPLGEWIIGRGLNQ